MTDKSTKSHYRCRQSASVIRKQNADIGIYTYRKLAKNFAAELREAGVDWIHVGNGVVGVDRVEDQRLQLADGRMS